MTRTELYWPNGIGKGIPDRQPHNGKVSYSTLHIDELNQPSIEYNFRLLPLIVREMVCICKFPVWQSYRQYFYNQEKDPCYIYTSEQLKTAPNGTFCLECMKPHRFSIFNILQTCEGCSNYYVPSIKREAYPIKYYLCSRCDVPVRPRPKRSV